MRSLEEYYSALPEPVQGVLLYMRQYIRNLSPEITEQISFNTAFFKFNGKMFCYFGVEKKSNRPYIGFVYGYKMKNALLISGNRKQIKVMYLDTDKDLDKNEIDRVFKEAMAVMRK